jgi:hypothetical protein
MIKYIIIKILLLPIKIIVYPISIFFNILLNDTIIFIGDYSNIEHIKRLEKILLNKSK